MPHNNNQYNHKEHGIFDTRVDGVSVLIFRRSVHVVPSHPRRSSTFGVAPVINQDSTEAAATVLHKRACRMCP